MVPKKHILFQRHHAQRVHNISCPSAVAEGIPYHTSRTHDRAESGGQALNGRIAKPPIPPEQSISAIANTDSGSGIEHGPALTRVSAGEPWPPEPQRILERGKVEDPEPS
jgi:hypothetical protein